MSRNSARRRGRRSYNDRDKGKRNITFPQCPVCSRPVRDMAAAIAYRSNGQPCHFDCVLTELRQTERLESEEKLCYLGRGAFGVVVFRGSGAPIRYLVKRRIQYEDRDKPREWQKKLHEEFHES